MNLLLLMTAILVALDCVSCAMGVMMTYIYTFIFVRMTCDVGTLVWHPSPVVFVGCINCEDVVSN